jgi:hypothetical protein
MKRWYLVEVVAVVASVASVTMVAGCEVTPSEAHRVLRAQGFEEIELTGYAAFACSDGDSFSTSFRARNARGWRVDGVVCCGLFKACTVRF